MLAPTSTVTQAEWIGRQTCKTLSTGRFSRDELVRALWTGVRYSVEDFERQVDGAIDNFCPQYG
jgi:hypothetical protein